MVRYTFLFLVGWALATGAADAQTLDDERLSTFGQAAFYNYAEVGDVTITVHVWGAVSYPGLYEVPQGTQLNTLFSLAGGPSLGSRTNRERSTLSVQVFRREGGRNTVTFDAAMEDEVFAFDESVELRNGDTLVAQSYVRQRLNWRDIFPVLGAAASLALVVERLLR